MVGNVQNNSVQNSAWPCVDRVWPNKQDTFLMKVTKVAFAAITVPLAFVCDLTHKTFSAIASLFETKKEAPKPLSRMDQAKKLANQALDQCKAGYNKTVSFVKNNPRIAAGALIASVATAGYFGFNYLVEVGIAHAEGNIIQKGLTHAANLPNHASNAASWLGSWVGLA